jgi:hypothetical protein
MHGYDIYTPGFDFLSIYDNIFLLPVGQTTTQMLYIRRSKLQYEHEWLNNLLLTVWTEQRHNQPAGTLEYNILDNFGNQKAVSSFQITETGFQLRFAPGEGTYNNRKGKSSKLYIAKGAPVFKISHQIAFKGFTGADFACNHTELAVNKRIWLSAFGFIDATFKAGKIWDKSPFPMLILPRTEQSIFISSEAFMLMRPMEFISDEYAALFTTYHLKGLIFNRIPMLKKLRLREVLTFKAMYGQLTDKNNPQHNPAGLFALPDNTQFFKKTPYIEVGAGIENILNIIRIDYICRLTHRDLPQTDKWGIRIAAQFSF